MRDSSCVFNMAYSCAATTREFCHGCKFTTTEDEIKASRQASFERRMALGSSKTSFDKDDLRHGIITEVNTR